MEDVLWNEKNGDLTPIRIINGKGGKDRVVFIRDSALLYLKEYLNTKNEPCDYLFSHHGNKYGREAMWRICKKLKEAAGVTKPFSPHICRHTMATLLNKHGCPMQSIQVLLGHSSMTITSNVYAHTDINKVASDMSRFCA